MPLCVQDMYGLHDDSLRAAYYLQKFVLQFIDELNYMWFLYGVLIENVAPEAGMRGRNT